MHKKNLVVIHLESLNEQLLWQNYECFPNMNKFKEKMYSFDYFYSSATSTDMAMSDFMWGEQWYRLEETERFEQWRKVGGGQSLFDWLSEEGYYTQFLGYPSTLQLKGMDIFFSKTDYPRSYVYEEYQNRIKECVEKDLFGIYIWDCTSHLNLQDERKDRFLSGYDKRIQGYRSLDQTFGTVIDLLKKYNRLKDTVIIAFGDHGDDYWTHELNSGFAHANTPYANLIKTPLWIYDGANFGRNNQYIVSTPDLKRLSMALVSGQEDAYDFLRERKYVFARNLLANQRQNILMYRLKRGYAVANKKYILVLQKKGYEMYYVNLDPTNNGNLLEFFRKSKNGIKPLRLFGFLTERFILHHHMCNFLNKEEMRLIQEAYLELKTEMNAQLDFLYGLNVKNSRKLHNRQKNKIRHRHHYQLELYRIAFCGCLKLLYNGLIYHRRQKHKKDRTEE